MRVGQLRSLLSTLRAAGVSEYSDTKSGVVLKFGAGWVPLEAGKAKDKRKDDLPQTLAQKLESPEAREAMKGLGITSETAHEVLNGFT
jgi:hypothetical protein